MDVNSIQIMAKGRNTVMNDIVANSSLTATASEFVPSAVFNRCQQSSSDNQIVHRSDQNGASYAANDSAPIKRSGKGTTSVVYNATGQSSGFKNNRQDRQSPKPQFKDWNRRKNQESHAEGRNPSRSSPQNQTSQNPRHNAGGKSFGSRGFKDATSDTGSIGQDSSESRASVPSSSNQHESAVDGTHNPGSSASHTTYYKNNAPGYKRQQDRNGNKNFRDHERTNERGMEQVKNYDGDHHRNRERYYEGERNVHPDDAHTRDTDRPQPRNHQRGRDWGRENQRDHQKSNGRNKHPEREWDQLRTDDGTHFRERTSDRPPERNQDDRYRERNRVRNYQQDGSSFRDHNQKQERYPDNAYSDSYPERSGERHQNRFHGRYPDRHNDRYQDRFNKYQDSDRNRRQYHEQDRDYNDQDPEYDGDSRGYSRRDSRQYDDSRSDYGRKRNTGGHYGEGSGSSSSNINVQETFGSNNYIAHGSENASRDKPVYNSRKHEGNYNSSHRPSAMSRNNIGLKDCDDVSQRERLTDQLTRGALECLVCCDRVRQQDSVWSCTNCYHVLHLRCVIKWAKSSKADSGWRCPACQNITKSVPSQYRCFCGKMVDPLWNRQDTPHTCGEMCGKSREALRPLCTHRCTLLCHPGPCPQCVAQVSRNCGCGKTSQRVKCGLDKPLLCDSVCAKPLNCGGHNCMKTCHTGPCEPCDHKINQVCFCQKEKREVDCTLENQGIANFCCGDICGQTLSCGNHKCESVCHPGPCQSCQLTPDIVTHCPCGKTKLDTESEQKRSSCSDPIPTCGAICDRALKCGQPSNPHSCKSQCHTGDCPPCPLSTLVRCRCGYMDREIPCEHLTTKADDARCEKKCTKKRSCAKHKCNQFCCIEVDHPCPLPCNHMLTCGQHRCEQLCHRGHCQPCYRTSFEELFCECGAEVFYPPIPCGTKPPPCSRPCSRQHECDHPALHTCHSEPNCPPCTVLTQKWCHGKHEMRKIIPCHQKDFSCGLPCNKELPCGRHRCIQACHKDDCSRSGTVCTQPCTALRPACQHPCSAQCHEGNCPDVPCKETVRVTCECGHRSAMRPCAENTQEYRRIATSLLASKMADVQLGHSIDIGDIMGNPSTKKLYLKSLECTEECKVIERNRRLAIGLQIRNPDLSSKLTPRYSEFMRGWAKKDPHFCQMVHDKLTELVKLAKDSKQKSRSYSFEVMNRDKRQFVHEYCEHFGCESVAYDQEPKRNIVATAQKDKAWLPSVGLIELVQREAGQRKVPGPMLSSVKKPVSRTMDTLPNKWSTKPSICNSSTASGGVASPGPSSSTMYNTAASSSSSSSNQNNASGPSHAYIDHFNS